MPAQVAVDQEVFEQVERITRPVGRRRTAVKRLALLVTGIIAAKQTVLAEVAATLFALNLTRAGKPESRGPAVGSPPSYSSLRLYSAGTGRE